MPSNTRRVTDHEHALHAAAQARYAARRGPESAEQKAARAKRRQRDAVKNRARCRVYRAVKSGRLVRPDRCARCEVECYAEASHDDYERPLDVEWLCRTCHMRKDRRT